MAQRPDRPRAKFREVTAAEAADAADLIYEEVRRGAEQKLSQLPDDYAGIVDFVLANRRTMSMDTIDAALLISEFARYRAHQTFTAAELRQYRLMKAAHDASIRDYADLGKVLELTKRGVISRMVRLEAVDRGDGTVRTFVALAKARAADADAAAEAALNAESLRQVAAWIAEHPGRYLGDEDFVDDCAELAELVAFWPFEDPDAAGVRAGKIRILLRPLVKGLGADGEDAIVPADEADVDAVGVLALARKLV